MKPPKTDLDLAVDRHLPRRRLELPRQQPQQCRLSRTVDTDHRNAGVGPHTKVEVLEEGRRTSRMLESDAKHLQNEYYPHAHSDSWQFRIFSPKDSETRSNFEIKQSKLSREKKECTYGDGGPVVKGIFEPEVHLVPGS